MFLSLAQWLQAMSPDYGYLRVFQYLTFRAVMAALTALMIGLIAGPFVIRKLTQLKIGQPIRGYGVEAHLVKSGTPTMGGVLILLAIALSTLLWVDLSNRFVWIVLLVTLGWRKIPLAIHHWLIGCALLGIQHFRGQQPACDGTFLHLGAFRL